MNHTHPKIKETCTERIRSIMVQTIGSAIYKARTLWVVYNPMAQYNDRLVYVQSAVQDKNRSNSYINIDSLEEVKTNVQATAILQQIKTQEIIASNKKVNTDLISIYPNPANNYVEIKYNSDADGIFKLYNSIGEQIGNYYLSKEVNTQRLQLNSIANGVYHYDIEFANKKKSIGKLTIIK